MTINGSGEEVNRHQKDEDNNDDYNRFLSAMEMQRLNGAEHPNHPNFEEKKEQPKAQDLHALYECELPILNPPQLIKRALPRNGTALMAGQSQAGKSFAAVDMAISLTTGRPFFGNSTRERVGVIWIASEGAHTMGARIRAAKDYNNIKQPLPIRVIRTPPTLLCGQFEELDVFIGQLQQLARAQQKRYGLRTGVVIIDTLVTFIMVDNENDAAQAAMACVMMRRIADAMDAIVMGIRHFGKNEDLGMRGSSAWKDNTDHVITVLAKIDQATGKSEDVRSINIVKNIVGEPGPISSFTLETVRIGTNQYGEDEFTRVVKKSDLPYNPEKPDRAEKYDFPRYKSLAMECLRECIIENPTIRNLDKNGPPMKCVPLTMVEKEFKRRWVEVAEKDSKAKFNQWKKAVAYLNESKEVGKENDKLGVAWLWLIKSEIVKSHQVTPGDQGDW